MPSWMTQIVLIAVRINQYIKRIDFSNKGVLSHHKTAVFYPNSMIQKLYSINLLK
jgi:hypothetical protein